jgi:hypothetical protein
MPCNVDIATQEILKLAEVANPSGIRTMGVPIKRAETRSTHCQNARVRATLERIVKGVADRSHTSTRDAAGSRREGKEIRQMSGVDRMWS